MKTALLALALGLSVSTVMAQPQGGTPPRGERSGSRPEGGPGEGHRPPPPILAALDADGDGTISAQEIANAAEALKKLDKNGDGALTRDEVLPPRPGGRGGEGRGPGDRAGGGPRNANDPNTPANTSQRQRPPGE